MKVRRDKNQVADITVTIFAILIAWELATKIFGMANNLLFPPPEKVFNVFADEWPQMLLGLASSMVLLVTGIVSALVTGTFLGLIIGWWTSLKSTVFPFIKILAPIPPLIYTPYLIGISPTFWTASVIIIFLGVFFPTTMIVINRTGEIDKRLIDTAKSFNLSNTQMIKDILFPYSLPSIIDGLSFALTMSFMSLTMAEMIGARSGLGHFVKRAAEHSEYHRVIAGIIFISIVITALNMLTGLLKRTVRR
jgi:NitT/TauT family transport system permease protein